MNAIDYACNPTAAKHYVTRRYETNRDSHDVEEVTDNLLSLPYVAVRINPNGTVLVGETKCKSVTCAVAYILARWW